MIPSALPTPDNDPNNLLDPVTTSSTLPAPAAIASSIEFAYADITSSDDAPRPLAISSIVYDACSPNVLTTSSADVPSALATSSADPTTVSPDNNALLPAPAAPAPPVPTAPPPAPPAPPTPVPFTTTAPAT